MLVSPKSFIITSVLGSLTKQSETIHIACGRIIWAKAMKKKVSFVLKSALMVIK